VVFASHTTSTARHVLHVRCDRSVGGSHGRSAGHTGLAGSAMSAFFRLDALQVTQGVMRVVYHCNDALPLEIHVVQCRNLFSNICRRQQRLLDSAHNAINATRSHKVARACRCGHVALSVTKLRALYSVPGYFGNSHSPSEISLDNGYIRRRPFPLTYGI